MWGGFKFTILLLSITTSLVSHVLSTELRRLNYCISDEDNLWIELIMDITPKLANLVLILLVCSHSKLGKILHILTILHQTQISRANASTVPSFIYKDANSTPESQEKIDITTEYCILALCICILIWLMIITTYMLKRKLNKTVLLAEITNGYMCMHVPLVNLSVCPSYCTVRSPNEISAITVQGKLSPYIYFEWDNFEVLNILNNKKLKVNRVHAMSIMTGRRAREILTTAYNVNFYVQHDSKLYHVA